MIQPVMQGGTGGTAGDVNCYWTRLHHPHVYCLSGIKAKKTVTQKYASKSVASATVIDLFQALWLALQVECGDLDPKGPTFDIHVLDPFFSRPYCHFAK